MCMSYGTVLSSVVIDNVIQADPITITALEFEDFIGQNRDKPKSNIILTFQNDPNLTNFIQISLKL